MITNELNKDAIHATGEATGFLPARANKGKPITVIGTEAIRETFDSKCLEQALNSRSAPGVTDLVLNPDAHCGYGAPGFAGVGASGGGRRRLLEGLPRAGHPAALGGALRGFRACRPQ